jgi:hypothetical protein
MRAAALRDNPPRIVREALQEVFDAGRIGFGGGRLDCREMDAAILSQDRTTRATAVQSPEGPAPIGATLEQRNIARPA